MYNKSCGECGVEYAVPDDFQRRRQKDGQTFYCPNGHPRYYPGESDDEKIDRLWAELGECKSDNLYLRRSRANALGQVTKMKAKVEVIE